MARVGLQISAAQKLPQFVVKFLKGISVGKCQQEFSFLFILECVNRIAEKFHSQTSAKQVNDGGCSCEDTKAGKMRNCSKYQLRSTIAMFGLMAVW